MTFGKRVNVACIIVFYHSTLETCWVGYLCAGVLLLMALLVVAQEPATHAKTLLIIVGVIGRKVFSSSKLLILDCKMATKRNLRR